jgi:integrase
VTVARALGPGSLKKRPLPAGGASWTLDYTSATGRRKRVVLGSDKRVAERRRADLVRKRDLELAGLGSEEGQSMPLAELRELYVADLKHHVSARHLLNVELKLRKLLDGLDATRVRDVTPHIAIVFRDKLVVEGASHRTANLYANTLRGMLRWAADAGLIAKNPIERLKPLPEGPRHTRCNRRAMSEEEITKFIAAAEVDDRRCEEEQAASRAARVRGRRLRVLGAEPSLRVPQAPFWRTLLETGARYGELQMLVWGDVDLAERLITDHPARRDHEGRPPARAPAAPGSRAGTVGATQRARARAGPRDCTG